MRRLLKLAAGVAFLVLASYLLIMAAWVSAWSSHPDDDYYEEADSTTDTTFAHSKRVDGVAFLTTEQPQIDIPLTVTTNGIPAETLDLEVWVSQVIPFSDQFLDVDDVTITETLIEPGSAIVTIALSQPTSGAAQVNWHLEAANPRDLYVEADPPPDTFGPPALFVEARRSETSPLPSRHLRIDAQPGSTPHLLLLTPNPIGRVRLSTEDGPLPIDTEEQLHDIALPQRCLSAPDSVCSFDVIFAEDGFAETRRIAVVTSTGTVETTDLGEPDWQVVAMRGRTDPGEITEETQYTAFSTSVDFEPPAEPLSRHMTFTRFDLQQPPETPGQPVIFAEFSSYLLWGGTCCQPNELSIEVSVPGQEFEPFTATADWTVEVWSPIEPASELTVEVEGPR